MDLHFWSSEELFWQILSPFPSDIFINKKKKENNSLAIYFIFFLASKHKFTSFDFLQGTASFPTILNHLLFSCEQFLYLVLKKQNMMVKNLRSA